jgi:hypothetical protein
VEERYDSTWCFESGEERRITATGFDKVMEHLLDGSASLCTDEATNYKRFAELKGLKHHTVNTCKKEYVKRGVYHIQ